MNDNRDERLNLLFAKARTAEARLSVREEGFEGRLLQRIREQRLAASPWYLWAWRSVPIFSAVIVLLLMLSGFQGAGTGAYLSHALTGGDDESALVSYYTGE